MTIHTTKQTTKKLQIAISGRIVKCGGASQLCYQNATIKMHNFVENDEKVLSYIYIIYCSIMSQKTSREKTTWRHRQRSEDTTTSFRKECRMMGIASPSSVKVKNE